MRKIFFVAGEASGDMHGANLIRELCAADPELQCSGLGGQRMAGAGMDLVYDLAGDAIMGFVEVLHKGWFIRRLFIDTVARVRRERPDCVVLIDYPGFNIRFAKEMHALDIPVVYYISPQVWAWKRKRLDLLAQLVAKMLVILPFEEALYRDKGVDCVYVGHPLLDEIGEYRPSEKQQPDKMTLVLLPGSRAQEIQRIAPVMAEVGAALLELYPGLRFLTPCINEARAAQVREILGTLPVEITVGGMYDALAVARCALVASGTATLETAVFGVPMCIVYRVNPISYWLARFFIRIRFIGIVNILMEREVAPELIQQDASRDNIVRVMRDLLEDTDIRARMLNNFGELKRRLGAGGASQRAAEEILRLLDRICAKT